MEIPADLLAPLAPVQDPALELELMTAPAPLLEQLMEVLLAPVREVTGEIELEPHLAPDVALALAVQLAEARELVMEQKEDKGSPTKLTFHVPFPKEEGSHGL